ncbi:MAG: hypothetical protein ABNH42_04250 [Marinobacter sp.]|jgi:dihydroxyacetone kinase|uniref:hypothetical protein n=1 Tax=Alcanivorax jadensis TaxID=64988 RepID=UPI001C321948|nr:hypothetical protein [Alcanivorax jadensis]QVW08765.1 hypothetical protein CBW1004CProp1_gp14 [Phage CBW1004C-Prop1]
MRDLTTIEKMTKTAVLEAMAICQPSAARDAGNPIEMQWRGRWLLAIDLCGAGHPVTLACYRGQTLISAAINHRYGLPTPMPIKSMLYPSEAA